MKEVNLKGLLSIEDYRRRIMPVYHYADYAYVIISMTTFMVATFHLATGEGKVWEFLVLPAAIIFGLFHARWEEKWFKEWMIKDGMWDESFETP